MAEKQTARGGRSTSDPKKTRRKSSAEQKPTRKTRKSSANNSPDAKKKSGGSAGKSTRTSRSKQSSPASKTSEQKKAPARKTRSKSTPAKTRKPRATKRPEITKRVSTTERLGAAIHSAIKKVQDPAFWQGMAQKLPPWTDEVIAILLIVLGVVMFTALLNTASEAVLSVTLSRVLRQIFGYGAYLVALSVIATGTIILLPKFGIVIKLGWTRIAAIEIAFASFTALLHLLANDPESRVLAREGKGGGYLGWGLMQIGAGFLGHTLAIMFFAILMLAGLTLASGIRTRHVLLGVQWLRARLQRSITHLESQPPEADYGPGPDQSPYDSPSDPNPYGRGYVAPPEHPAPETPRRPSVVPRDDTTGSETPPESPSNNRAKRSKNGTSTHTNDNTPAQAAAPTPPAASQKQDNGDADSGQKVEPKPSRPKPRRLSKKEKRELVVKTRRKLGSANGRSLVAPGEPGTRSSVVPRELLPDARVVPAAPRARIRRKPDDAERYFNVEDFREVKKVGKRDKNLPPLEILSDIELNKPTEEEINTNARIIKNTLLEFDVETEVIDVKVGPTVTQYAVSPYTETVNDDGEIVLNRVRVSEITNLNGDLALALSARRLRIQAPVPGHSYVGIEVPNRQPSTVALRPVLESENFYRYRNHPLALPLGRDVAGEPFIADLGIMPHLLIAGTTGSGKSIMLAAMTTAFAMNNPPDVMKLVLLDPKMVELSRFNGLPHLLGPVETELDRIIGVLRWATREMDRRYKLLEKEAARNIEVFNKGLGRRRKDERLPYLVIVIDEIGDLMMQRPDETERALTRLAQMARAVGIHLMVATQRPSVDVITGLIKANFPARISFVVASGVDSRVVLDSTGAETLMGQGDMLFLAPDAAGPRRIQGCYISDEEVNDVVDYWKQWHEEAIDEERVEPLSVAPWERGMTRREVLSETDPMLEDAIALVIAEGEASASLIQRRLGLGYPRAARIIDLLFELGVVGAARPGGRTREVLVKPGADPFKKLVDKRIKSRK